MKCRFCGNNLKHEFIDLGSSPPSNSFLTKEELNEPEVFYPLKLFVCEKCFLVQIDEYKKSSEIFDKNYAYFSSYSKTWLVHSKKYVDMMLKRFGYNKSSQIIEIASNDGYLLQYFKEKKIPVLGIEPTKNTAEAARQKGIETITEFFGEKLAKHLVSKNIKADLLLGNNVLAHVPDINDFVKGLKLVLKDNGVITMEFPHLMQLIENNQFDTIYHEHFSYLSFMAVKSIFDKHRLEIFDVEELPTHGGSLRIYAKHKEDKTKKVLPSVKKLLEKERKKGMDSIKYYLGFQKKIDALKLDILAFLVQEKKKGKKIVGYGAAAKGNTLLNYCGIKKDLIDFVVDISPHKQGKFMPGSHIPVVGENILKTEKVNYIIIFPWNISDEIIKQLDYMKKKGSKFVILIPRLEVLS